MSATAESALKSVWRYFKVISRQIRTSLLARIPEKVIIYASYTSNALLITSQYIFRNTLSEDNVYILLLELIVVAQLFLPMLLLDLIPMFHYFVLLGFIAAGSFLYLVPNFPVYYYMLTLITVLILLKVEPVMPPSPTLVKISTRLRRALKKAQIPRTVEEVKFSFKVSMIHLISLAMSLIIFFTQRYPPSILVASYSAIAFLVFFMGIGTSPLVRVPKAKYSLSLLFVLRYPFLFRLANNMKMKIHPLTERAGVLIYELEYVAKYVAYITWYVMVLPAIYLMLFAYLPLNVFLTILPTPLIVVAMLYYYPFLSLTSKERSRKNNVEKEYPIFLAYASALVSAGYTLYQVFKDLATGKGAELLKAFTNEARYFLSFIDKQGLPELRAIERYAATHPSSEYRNFILGYMHQRQLGGRISMYMEQKLIEALDAFKRRMENYVNQITTLAEIALTVLTIPTLPMVVGFIIAPEIVYNMLFLQLFVFVPAVGFMFYSVAASIQPEFKDEYKFTYIPSVVLGAAGLVVSLLLIRQNLVAGISFIGGMIALGYYIEYSRFRRIYGEIEKTLPQLFRDLSELRQMMPISEALNRMVKMGYPKHVTRILQKVAAQRAQGIKLTEQPWASKSWFWKFTQFIIGKIEESGGGTAELFRQLMLFFTEFNNIMSSVRSALKIYEFVIYTIPAIFAVVSYSTLGIFVAMSQVSQSMGIGNMTAEAGAQLGAQFPQLMKLFKGIEPTVLLINDIIIVEMSFILGLLGGKVVSGTLRDTRALAITLLITSIVIIVAPQFVTNLIQQAAAGQQIPKP